MIAERLGRFYAELVDNKGASAGDEVLQDDKGQMLSLTMAWVSVVQWIVPERDRLLNC